MSDKVQTGVSPDVPHSSFIHFQTLDNLTANKFKFGRLFREGSFFLSQKNFRFILKQNTIC